MDDPRVIPYLIAAIMALWSALSTLAGLLWRQQGKHAESIIGIWRSRAEEAESEMDRVSQEAREANKTALEAQRRQAEAQAQAIATLNDALQMARDRPPRSSRGGGAA